MTSYGQPHKLIVHEVGELYGPLSTEDFAHYDIEHPAECEYDPEAYRHNCGVGWEEAEGCLRYSLQYTGTPINEPGEYWITAWSEVYRGFEYTEHDGGVAVLDRDEWPLAAERSAAAKTVLNDDQAPASAHPNDAIKGRPHVPASETVHGLRCSSRTD